MKSPYKVVHSARSWLRVSGADALRFLNGMWTADFKLATRDSARLPAGGASFFLDLKGKPVSPAIFVAISPSEFVFSVPATEIEALRDALDRYIVADDVNLEIVPDFGQAHEVPSGLDASEAESKRIAPLVPADPSRLYQVEKTSWGFRVPRGTLGERHEEIWILAGQQGPAPLEEISAAEHAALRVEHGQPEWGRDFGRDSLILEYPHLDAISFHKGCYIGQEVVARATYRGRMVKGFCRLSSPGELEEGYVYGRAEPDKPVGKLTTVSGKRGLGLLRLRAIEDGGGLFQKSARGEVTVQGIELLLPSEGP